MSDKDDNKPVIISLAAKRKDAEGRDFAQERGENVRHLLQIGLSEQEATAIADEVLLWDWLVFQARMSLDRWEGHASSEAVVQLAEMMRRRA